MEDRVLIGKISRLQVARECTKIGNGSDERFAPAGKLVTCSELKIESIGATGFSDSGESIMDIHHRDHPNSRYRGANSICFIFSSHYDRMRERLGDHIADGLAGENILIEQDHIMDLVDVEDGITINGEDGPILLSPCRIADPCSPFGKFCLRFPAGKKADKSLTECLRFLSHGTRGFYATINHDSPSPVSIHVGDLVYRTCSR